MAKIFWTSDEQDAVYAAMVELFANDSILRKEVALQEAQKVLPYERRRKIHYSAVYRYKDLIDRARSEAKNRPKTPTQAPPALVAPTEPPTDLLRAILDQFLDALADKVAERIQLRQEESAAPRPKHDPSPICAPRESRIGVLIIGLLNQQSQTIIRSFPHMEFTCLTPEQALSREQLRRSHTILMTKCSNHSIQDKYRKVPNLHLCNGGVSELSAILKSIS